MKVDGQYYFYQNDHLGTPQKLTAVNGAVVWSGKYFSFGQVNVGPSSTVFNNLRFAGQYFDQETGLHYNYFRYYDPKASRYLNPDPIGIDGGINFFAYVHNNPVSLLDPLGLRVTYSVHTVGATFLVAEGDIGIAYAESDCVNGKKYVAIYLVGAAGFNVGLEIKAGKLVEVILNISTIVSNANSLLEGDTFTLEGDIPEIYVSYLDVGAFQASGVVTLSAVDIQMGPYEGGRKIEDPMFNAALTGDIGVSLASGVGYNLLRIYMKEKDCCK
jgi:RHS repeat-associated protein